MVADFPAPAGPTTATTASPEQTTRPTANTWSTLNDRPANTRAANPAANCAGSTTAIPATRPAST